VRFETDRLILRPLRVADAADLLQYQSRAEVVTYIPWPQRTIEQVEEALVKTVAEFKDTFQNDHDYANYGWELKQGGQVIGQSNISLEKKEHQSGDIGWVVHPDFKAQGYAAEATRKMLDVGFNHYGLRRITAYIDIRNEPSIKLAKAIGMRHEGTYIKDEFFKGEYTSAHLYALLVEEFNQN
jgi:RimJ/RimL family protein N-acetyltransferase